MFIFNSLVTNSDGTREKCPHSKYSLSRTIEGGAGTAFLPGYGIDNGVRYLAIQKGEDGNNTPATAGTIKIALLSLGQSADWNGESQTETGKPPVYTANNNAGDLGDLYQWGRVADGHQNIAWSKTTTYLNQITGSSGVNVTSEVVARVTPLLDANIQILPADTTHYGKFISGRNADWVVPNASNRNRWGDGSTSASRTSDISLAKWIYPQNNPCPAGWIVPSCWNLWDIYQGNGTDTDITQSPYTGTVNEWRWRPKSNSDKVYGGVIITNKDGEKVFLPATGSRNIDGTLNGGNVSYLWTNTNQSGSNNQAHSLNAVSSVLYPGYNSHGYGMSVRCVQEVQAAP